MKIRRATHFDLADLYELFSKLRDFEQTRWSMSEEAYPWFEKGPADELAFCLERTQALTNPSVGYFVAENSAGQIVGYLLSSVYTRPVGAPAITCSVHEFYVEPGLRTKEPDRVSSELARVAKQWAKSQSASHVEIQCVAAETQVNFWKARGYKPYRVYLQRELE